MTQDEKFIRSLARYDTPTICNAIEVAEGKRGFDDYTRGTFQVAMNGAKAMVGYARTAKIAGREPATETPEVIKARRLDYFRYMADGPRPSVCVIEDEDAPYCVSAWWGEVHTVVHNSLGLSGAITNGVMRDLDDHQEGFPVIAGSIGPSHAFVHLTEIGHRCRDIWIGNQTGRPGSRRPAWCIGNPSWAAAGFASGDRQTAGYRTDHHCACETGGL